MADRVDVGVLVFHPYSEETLKKLQKKHKRAGVNIKGLGGRAPANEGDDQDLHFEDVVGTAAESFIARREGINTRLNVYVVSDYMGIFGKEKLPKSVSGDKSWEDVAPIVRKSLTYQTIKHFVKKNPEIQFIFSSHVVLNDRVKNDPIKDFLGNIGSELGVGIVQSTHNKQERTKGNLMGYPEKRYDKIERGDYFFSTILAQEERSGVRGDLTGNFPVVSAQGHYTKYDEKGNYVRTSRGTSNAAPRITGALAALYVDAYREGILPKDQKVGAILVHSMLTHSRENHNVKYPIPLERLIRSGKMIMKNIAERKKRTPAEYNPNVDISAPTKKSVDLL